MLSPSNNVVVPNSEIELTAEQLSYLESIVNPTSDDGNNGIDHFIEIAMLGVIYTHLTVKKSVIWG